MREFGTSRMPCLHICALDEQQYFAACLVIPVFRLTFYTADINNDRLTGLVNPGHTWLG
jgi:hypothetical protein